jgi:hypothetical protein
MTDTVSAAAAEAIARRTRSEMHDIALVLGSGCAPAADLVGDVVAEVKTAQLPGFAPAAVPGHVGRLRSVRIGDGRALVFLSRTHLYEGRGVRPVYAVRNPGPKVTKDGAHIRSSRHSPSKDQKLGSARLRFRVIGPTARRIVLGEIAYKPCSRNPRK